MSVVLHPSAVLSERLREASKSSGDALVQLFFEAIDLGTARKPILEYFSPQKNALSIPNVGWTSLFDWSGGKSFRAKRRRIPVSDVARRKLEASTDEAPLSQEAQERWVTLGAETARIQMAHSEHLQEIARVHRYGMFPPGWQVENVAWSNTFGTGDPCLVIADYIRGLFSGPSRYDRAKETVHILDGTDRKILDIILSCLAKELTENSDYFHGYNRVAVRRVLNTACVAWVWGEEIDCYGSGFFDHLASAPATIARALLNLWAEIDHEWADRHREVQPEVLQRQNAIVAACLVRHLTARGAKTNSTYPLEELLDKEAIDAIPNFSAMEVQELLHLKSELWSSSDVAFCGSDAFAAEAIYNARDVIFGGVFPFPISEAVFYIGALEGNTDFWLACISRYTTESYDLQEDPYRVFDWPQSEQKSDDRGADLCRPTSRFDAFCSAYAEMRETRLDELADAWWAFFIASQSLAFPSMGLSPAQFGRLADITKKCTPNKMIEKALRFALEHSDVEAQPLQARVFRHAIESLLPTASLEKNSITELRPTAGRTRAFLEDRIGAKTWAALCEESQNDLLDAERLWNSASHDYGAGRKDWGAIVAIYSRVMESEMRSQLASVYDALDTAGIPIRERTFGRCLTAIRSANDALRKGGLDSLPEDVALRVRKVHRFFSDEVPFMKDQRDRAAHGNRETIITPNDFYKWRTAILHQKVLSVIIGPAG